MSSTTMTEAPVGTDESTRTAPTPMASVARPREGRAKRRTFTTEHKRRIVAEYDAAPNGTKGAVLRRERLYDSHVQEWRAAIASGTLDDPPKRGRPRKTAEEARIVELERQVARLEAEATRKDEVIADRDAALEVLGKVSRSWRQSPRGTRDDPRHLAHVASGDRRRTHPPHRCR